jgi:dienelactone hydrolase
MLRYMPDRMSRVLFGGRLVGACALGVALAGFTGRAQENPAIDHAKRVLDLIQHEKFDEVAQEFNAQVAAALSPSQMRDVWATVRRQVGTFTSVIGQRVVTPSAGVTAVVLGCQFEKTTLNVIVAFDAENKIAGLRFTPRAATATEESAAPPASSRFKEEPVTVGAGEWALPGTLSMPVGPIAAAIVLVHGSGPGDRDETVGANKPFRDLAWGLADRGIAVLRYEKRTRRYPDKLAGNPHFTVREETIEDALAAAALLRAHDRIDPKRVFLLGHSLGGTLAPRIATEDRSLAGLVILAGATRPLLDAARAQLTYLATLNPPGAIHPDEEVQRLRSRAPESYWKDFDAYKPAQTAATLTIPMLILQGERDYQVTLEDLQGWRDALERHAGVTIKTYPTLNHLFLSGVGKSTPFEYDQAGHIPDFVFEDIAGWLKTS